MPEENRKPTAEDQILTAPPVRQHHNPDDALVAKARAIVRLYGITFGTWKGGTKQEERCIYAEPNVPAEDIAIVAEASRKGLI